MKHAGIAAAATLLAALVAASAHAQWSSGGWGVGNGSRGELGRAEGPIVVDVGWMNDVFVDVSVNGCGGERDVRAFGTHVADGDRQAAEATAALVRLLGEARRVCGFEPALESRIAEGFEPAFTAWLEEATLGNDIGMDLNMIDMNSAIDCTDPDNPEVCNAM